MFVAVVAIENGAPKLPNCCCQLCFLDMKSENIFYYIHVCIYIFCLIIIDIFVIRYTGYMLTPGTWDPRQSSKQGL